MTPLLASYLTGVIVLLMFSWANGMDYSKHWVYTYLLVVIWPIILIPIVVFMRIGWNKEQAAAKKARRDAGTK